MARKQKLLLKVNINGMTKAARTALDNLEAVCREHHNSREYSIEVVDIREHPQLAEDEKIIATPTVIRKLPLPVRRVIGDLSEREQLLVGLDLLEN